MDEDRGRGWMSWKRAAVLLLTIAAMVLVFRRIDGATLWEALARMRVGWFGVALGLYGLAFLIAGWRWHLVLRVTGCGVHSWAAVRLSYIGHYLVVVLFGGVQADVAKCSIYGRWYDYSFADVFATSPLDRLLGMLGLMAFGVVAFAWAAAGGGLEQLGELNVRTPGPWIGWVLAAVLVGTVALIYFKPTGEHVAARMLRAIQEGAKRVCNAPKVAGVGFVCAVLVQFCLSGVLALCVMAVTRTDVAWGDLIWTFPLITTLSSLPVTFAGLGVREGATIVLLGLYGVPESEALAGALLGFFINLAWGGVGGWMLWSESHRFGLNRARRLPRTISVVIPTLNEAEALGETVRAARGISEVTEIIVADGGSVDGTVGIAEGLGCRVVRTEAGRGRQLRAGAEAAVGDVVLLLHADTLLPSDAGRALIDSLRDKQAVGGGFWKVFRDGPMLLKGSKFRCGLRLLLFRRILGDQAFYARREELEAIGGVPEMDLMEDFALSAAMRKRGGLVLADATIFTSARRFAKLGVFRTYWRMWQVTWRYWRGSSGAELRRLYDRDGRG